MSGPAPQALVTGNSAGLGRALTQQLLAQGWHVYGCSRSGCDLPGALMDVHCDLSDGEAIAPALSRLLKGVSQLDLVVLNAGMLGEIKALSRTSVAELEGIFDLNLWANKRVLDWLLDQGLGVKQVVLISSGAAVLGNHGWGGYALSKAALNMLTRLYAHEFPHSHLVAIAPGLVETRMMDYLCQEADAEAFPALQRLQQARGTPTMLSPAQAAGQLIEALPRLRQEPSGGYVDLRQFFDPEAYAALHGGRS